MCDEWTAFNICRRDACKLREKTLYFVKRRTHHHAMIFLSTSSPVLYPTNKVYIRVLSGVKSGEPCCYKAGRYGVIPHFTQFRFSAATRHGFRSHHLLLHFCAKYDDVCPHVTTSYLCRHRRVLVKSTWTWEISDSTDCCHSYFDLSSRFRHWSNLAYRPKEHRWRCSTNERSIHGEVVMVSMHLE